MASKLLGYRERVKRCHFGAAEKPRPIKLKEIGADEPIDQGVWEPALLIGLGRGCNDVWSKLSSRLEDRMFRSHLIDGSTESWSLSLWPPGVGQLAPQKKSGTFAGRDATKGLSGRPSGRLAIPGAHMRPQSDSDSAVTTEVLVQASGRKLDLRRIFVFLIAVGSLLAVPVVADALTSPRTWVDSPAESSSVAVDLTITGSARHSKGVVWIELVVKNRDDRTYWNGSRWQRSFTRFTVVVDDPGASQTGWTYIVPAAQMSKGNYRARAFARSVEGNGDSYGGDANNFVYVGDLKPDLYDTAITSPTDGSKINGPIRVEGRATSIEGVAAVDVVIRDRSNNRYWNAETGAWSTSFTTSEAALSDIGGSDISWVIEVPAKLSPSSSYTTRAWVVTSTGKGDPFGRGQASFTVGAANVPPAPAPPTPVPAPTTERVIWEDDFTSLDRTRWPLEHSTYGDGNNELQCYRPENVSVSDGRLTLRAVTETFTCPNGSTRSVTSGMVRSRGVSFGPGQAIEFRVKLAPGDQGDQGGLWPAVWSSGWAGGGWPKGGEMDYLEVMTAKDPKRSVHSVHFAKPDGSWTGEQGRSRARELLC